MIFEDVGGDGGFQGVEGFGIAEKAGDVNEHVLIEGLDFGLIALDIFDVVFQLFDFVGDHAALNAAKDGGLAVVREIDAGGAAEQLEDGGKGGVVGREQFREFGYGGTADVGVVGDAG